MFILKNVAISLAMVVVLGALDALGKADVLPQDAGLVEHLKFMGLRAPLIFDQVFIFAFLLSLLVTYVVLIRRNELVPIASAGMSATRQILALMPAVLVVSALYAVLIDQATPRAQQALLAWLGPEAVTKNTGMTEDFWVADGTMLVRIEKIEDRALKGLTLFERAEVGALRSVSRAASAELDDGLWRLSDVTQIRFDAQDVNPPDHWDSQIDAATLRLLAMEPRYLSVAELWSLAQLKGIGNRTASVYHLWILNRASLPLAAIGFMIVTVLIMQKFGRDPKAEITLVFAMGGGFLYVIFDKIVKSLPDKSGVSWLAAGLAPLACLALACIVLAIRNARS